MSVPFETIGLAAGAATLISVATAWIALRETFSPPLADVRMRLAESLGIGAEQRAESVLLIKPDVRARMFLHRALAAAGYDVTDASREIEAYEALIRSGKPAPGVVIVDVPATEFTQNFERRLRSLGVVFVNLRAGAPPEPEQGEAAASELRSRLAFAQGKMTRAETVKR